jgi:hypothetical protein
LSRAGIDELREQKQGLDNRVALITGGASDFGKRIAETFFCAGEPCCQPSWEVIRPGCARSSGRRFRLADSRPWMLIRRKPILLHRLAAPVLAQNRFRPQAVTGRPCLVPIG